MPSSEGSKIKDKNIPIIDNQWLNKFICVIDRISDAVQMQHLAEAHHHLLEAVIYFPIKLLHPTNSQEHIPKNIISL